MRHVPWRRSTPVVHAHRRRQIEQVPVEAVAHLHLRVGLEDGAVAVDGDAGAAEPVLAALLGPARGRHGDGALEECRGRSREPRDMDGGIGMEAGAHPVPVAIVAREGPALTHAPHQLLVDEPLHIHRFLPLLGRCYRGAAAATIA